MIINIIEELQHFMIQKEALPLQIEPVLENIQAELNGATVQMQSWSWQTPEIHLARLTYLHCLPRVELFNFTIYPQSHLLGAMFATDWVILGGKLRIGVIDAMPFFSDATYQKYWVNPFEPLHTKSLSIAPTYERTDEWSFDYMSPYACLASQLTDISPLMALWKQYFSTYYDNLCNAPLATKKQQIAQLEWQNKYNQDHLEVELRRNPLLHYFGKELGERYLREFLFAPIH